MAFDQDDKFKTWPFICGHFRKKILRKGCDFDKPHLESVCCISLRSDTTEQMSDFQSEEELQRIGFLVGDEIQVKIGSPTSAMMVTVEKCLMTMKVNEESLFLINISDSNQSEMKEKDMSGYVQIMLTLHTISELRPSWDLGYTEKYNLALAHKETGKQLFTENPELAFHEFSVAVQYLLKIPTYSQEIITITGISQAEKDEYEQLKCVCYLNLAACQAKYDNHTAVIKNCSHALSLQPSNLKGLYRRGKAYLALGQDNEAKKDLLKMSKLSPRNQEVISLLSQMKQGK